MSIAVGTVGDNPRDACVEHTIQSDTIRNKRLTWTKKLSDLGK